MAELLFVPFKKSSDVDIVKPLKNLIQATYNTAESTEDYTDALNELSRLRANAVWKVFEKCSLDTIYSYYDALVCLESKIPPQEVQIPFKWKDAFDKGSIFGGRMSLTISSLGYERMCILFNMAAMQSAVAAQQTLDTEESLKLAAKLLQQSAGIFTYLKANIMMAVHQETTPDLNPETLDALAKLMLAQAQEVIAYKCIRDEMKESMVAKVCAQCEEFYTDALRMMQKEHLKPLWERDWIPTVAAKQMAFRGLAHYYQSLVCRSNKAVGEEISRLQFAVEQLKGAQSRITHPGFLQEQVTKASRNLAEANKDNDFIYHERIPDVKQLEPISRAAIAKPLPLQDKWAQGGRDLFANLVPMAVHQALQASSARKSELVNAEINKLRDATQLLNSILASLNLPACVEAEAGDAGCLPESIRAKAKAVREAGGVQELQRLMAELPELLQRNTDILDEAERMLREEAEADASLRAQFGARWSRTESAKLTEAFKANATKYRQIIDNAIRADNIVQQKYAQHKANIALLSGNEGDINADLPEAPENMSNDQSALRTLKSLMDTVERIKAERDGLEAELKDATIDLREKFLSALAADGAVDEPALSAAALGAALAPLQRRVQETVQQQQDLVADIQRPDGGARRRERPRRGARQAVRRVRRLPGPHRQPQGGRQVLQRPHTAVGGVPEQGVGLLLRAQDREGRAAEGPDAGGGEGLRAPPAAAPAAPRRRRRRACPGEEGGAPPAPTPAGARRLCAALGPALPHAAAGHAAAIRGRCSRSVPVLRGPHARHVQPVRDFAVPTPRALAPRAGVPTVPVPPAAGLPTSPAGRIQPLPTTVNSSLPFCRVFISCYTLLYLIPFLTAHYFIQNLNFYFLSVHTLILLLYVYKIKNIKIS